MGLDGVRVGLDGVGAGLGRGGRFLGGRASAARRAAATRVEVLVVVGTGVLESGSEEVQFADDVDSRELASEL